MFFFVNECGLSAHLLVPTRKEMSFAISRTHTALCCTSKIGSLPCECIDGWVTNVAIASWGNKSRGRVYGDPPS